MPRPHLTHPVALTSATLGGALVAALVVGVAAGGAQEDSAPTTRHDAPQVETAAWDEALAPGSCAELLDHYRDLGAQRVGPYGWGSPYLRDLMFFAPTPDGVGGGGRRIGQPPAQCARGRPPHLAGDGQRHRHQRAGGRRRRARRGQDRRRAAGAGPATATLTTYDVTGREPVELGARPRPARPPRRAAAGRRPGVVLGSRTGPDGRTASTGRPSRRLWPTRRAPPCSSTTRPSTRRLVSAVQHGDTVRLVLSDAAARPRLRAAALLARPARRPRSAQPRGGPRAPPRRLAAARDHGRHGGTTRAAARLRQVTVPERGRAALGTMAVVGFDADDPATPTRMGSPPTPCSPTSRRPALPRHRRARLGLLLGRARARDRRRHERRRDRTGSTPSSSTAPARRTSPPAWSTASIADRWAMDEHDGVLRVAVGPSVGDRQLQLGGHAARGRRRAGGGRPRRRASARTSRSSRCAGSTAWRSW